MFSNETEMPFEDVGFRTAASLLTSRMLDRFSERGRSLWIEPCDRRNLSELKESGYLRAAIPEERGGFGLSLAQVCGLQQRLARVSMQTAAEVHRHLVVTGVAADLHRHANPALCWALDAAAAGAALSIDYTPAEGSLPLFSSTRPMTAVPGGWTTATPPPLGRTNSWDYALVCGLALVDDAHPELVHGFVERADRDLCVIDARDHPASTSGSSGPSDPIADTSAFVRDERVVCRTEPGLRAHRPFHETVYAWEIVGLGAMQVALAERTLDSLFDECRGVPGFARNSDLPTASRQAGQMRITFEQISALLETVAQDWSTGREPRNGWLVRLLATKHSVESGVCQILAAARELRPFLSADHRSGEFLSQAGSLLASQLGGWRADPAVTVELIGGLCLGVEPHFSGAAERADKVRP